MQLVTGQVFSWLSNKLSGYIGMFQGKGAGPLKGPSTSKTFKKEGSN